MSFNLSSEVVQKRLQYICMIPDKDDGITMFGLGIDFCQRQHKHRFFIEWDICRRTETGTYLRMVKMLHDFSPGTLRLRVTGVCGSLEKNYLIETYNNPRWRDEYREALLDMFNTAVNPNAKAKGNDVPVSLPR